MALQVRPFEVGDYIDIRVDHIRSFNGFLPTFNANEWAMLKKSGPTISAVEDGKVWAIAGIVRISPGLGEAWALIDSEVGKARMLSIHRAASRFVNTISGFEQINVLVNRAFASGSRWAEMLGFEYVGPVHKDSEPSRGYLLYTKVR